MSQDASLQPTDTSKEPGCTTPAQDLDLNVTLPSIAIWNDGDQAHELTQIDLQIHARQTAYLRLCIHIGIAGCPRRVPIYMYIYPDVVQNILLSLPDGNKYRCLNFVLAGRATVVTPSGDLMLKNQLSYDTWNLWSSLARQEAFIVMVPTRAIQVRPLERLCKALSARNVPGPSTSQHLDGLYSGRPAKISNDVDSWSFPKRPPPYEDLEPSPPKLTESRPPKRRRRASLTLESSSKRRATTTMQDGDERQLLRGLIAEVATQVAETFMDKWTDQIVEKVLASIRPELSELRKQVQAIRDPDVVLQEQIDEMRNAQNRHSVDLDGLREDVNTVQAVQEDMEEHVSELVGEKVRDSVQEALEGAEVVAKCEDVRFRIEMDG